jgi:hypothetical protein
MPTFLVEDQDEEDEDKEDQDEEDEDKDVLNQRKDVHSESISECRRKRPM